MYSQICSKMVFSVQNRINESWNWMYHIWINLATSCILKQTNSIAWTKFALKVYFTCDSLQRNKTITFSIFELVSVQSFILNNFFFWNKFAEKVYFCSKTKNMRKNCILSSNLTYLSYSAIIFIICWDFFMFYQIFFSPQVNRWAIITYKHAIYDLPNELPNDLRLRIFENWEISGRCLNPIEW